MSKALIYICAYNAEKTLQRTIDSVVAQTYPDWVCYIVDNGSLDNTGTMIQEYALRDDRIIHLTNKKNHVWERGNGSVEIIKQYTDNDFFCRLDADDEYKPEFLEKSIVFMKEHNLDIVASGNDFIDTQTNEICGIRVLKQSLILEERNFSELFPHYHQFMRTTWGKMYAISVLRKYNSARVPTIGYGWDTLYAQENFRNANRIGILAESLHKYYISPKSSSYKWDSKRVECDKILFDKAKEYLIAKCGNVTLRNQEFLLAIYMNALIDTLKVLLDADMSERKKIDALGDMFLRGHAKELAAQERFGAGFGSELDWTKRRNELFAAAAEWLLNREEVADQQVEDYCELGEFLCAACENAGGWLFFKKLLIQFLIENQCIDQAKPKIEELFELLPDDETLKQYRSL